MKKQWLILFKKEWTESLRNFKWFWLPTVFILLGLMQPITSYYLTDIIENFGGMPEGAVMELPMPTGAEVLAGTLSQFSQIGLLVLVLAFMGVVAGERSYGTHVMVMAKPVSQAYFLTAKLLHILLISTVAFILGFAGSVYYTFLLIESVPFANLAAGSLVYLLWLWFVMTLVLCLSSLFNSPAAAAFGSLGTALLLSVLSMYTPDLMRWSPGMLAMHSQSLFFNGEGQDGFLLSLTVTAGLIAVILAGTIHLYKKREVAREAA